MMTAFCLPLPEGTAVVACAKYFISLLNRHGSLPFRPIPRDESWATIRVALRGVEEAIMRIEQVDSCRLYAFPDLTPVCKD